MAVRFTCPVCPTVLKLSEAVNIERKVRCTGCGVVIMLTPDADSPTGMHAAVAEKKSKKGSGGSAGWRGQVPVMWGAAGLAVVILGFAIWWWMRPPSDRASIEGEVALNQIPLDKGTIKFISEDGKNITVLGLITNGRYKIEARHGPKIGPNKIEIRGERNTGKYIPKHGGRPGEEVEETVEAVSELYNTRTILKATVKPGNNVENFKVMPK